MKPKTLAQLGLYIEPYQGPSYAFNGTSIMVQQFTLPVMNSYF